MPRVDKADYVLIIKGRAMASGDNPDVLFSLFDLAQFGSASVKSFRLHHWIDGIPDSIFSHEHCQHCKATRQRNGSIDDQPCRYPERGDESVEVYDYHAPHTDDKCCTEHNHHAKTMHVNCFMR
jgi:hypothetical protein